MLRPRVLCGVIGLTALLAVTAVCQDKSARSVPPASRAVIPPSVPAPPQLAVPAPPLGTAAKPAGVDDPLDKLEGLKAKREAIEREEKATHALLKERLKAQQERIGKLGLGQPVPPLCEKQAGPAPDDKASPPPPEGKSPPATEALPKDGFPPR
jgi:hypothetical protein